MDSQTLQPPVRLDPNQDPAQQIAFINQNLQTMAAAIQTSLSNNSFQIVNIITIQLVLTASGTTSGKSAVSSVAHGLSFTPAYEAFISIDPSLASFFGVGSSLNGPNPFLVPTTTSGSSLATVALHQITVDSKNIYLSQFSNVQGTYSFTTSAVVYLLQKTAT